MVLQPAPGRWSNAAELQGGALPFPKRLISSFSSLFHSVMVMPIFGGPGTKHSLLLLVCVCLHVVPSKHTHILYKHTCMQINSDDRWVMDWNIASGKDQRKEVIQNPALKHNTHTHTHPQTLQNTKTCEYIFNHKSSCSPSPLQIQWEKINTAHCMYLIKQFTPASEVLRTVCTI